MKKVYRAIVPMSSQDIKSNTVIGQYAAGEKVIGYRQENKVSPDSTTPTYFAGKL